ncbi:hypothetical protein ACT29H_12860 [Thermophagus sp. OGC60D27]|uniref:hypothetical protein n=1 Tax=Thermophagus sp. OGC60D27 TaxID=3458415 RepID=UPI0040383463
MRFFAILLLLLVSLSSFSQVWVYDYPDTIASTSRLGKLIRSDVYDVTVTQNGEGSKAFVMADFNTFDHGQRRLMTEWNHFSTFSFSGKVEIKIRKKDGSSIGMYEVYPKRKQVEHHLTRDNKEMVISLGKPGKFYVKMEGMDDHPLFLFADGPETKIPKINAPGVGVVKTSMSASQVIGLIKDPKNQVIYFEKGIHSYGEETGKDYMGYQLPLLDNKTYYIPGGSVVIGSFKGEASNVTIRGRGIITGVGKERIGGTEGIPYNLIMLEGNDSGNQKVEGLTFTNPPHFVVLSRGEVHARNLKMFGWWHQTDGWGGGHHSSVVDCFFKVNDDIVKIYRDHQVAKDLVIYKQINGAAFQLGWNQYGQATNSEISDIYIVNDDPKTPKIPCNTAVFNLKDNDGAHISNIVFKNIYIENDVQLVFGLDVSGGSLKKLTFQNIHIDGDWRASNYIFKSKGALVKKIVFEDIFHKSRCIDEIELLDFKVNEDEAEIQLNKCSSN